MPPQNQQRDGQYTGDPTNQPTTLNQGNQWPSNEQRTDTGDSKGQQQPAFAG